MTTLKRILILCGLLAALALPAHSQQFITPNAVDAAALGSVRGGFGYGDNLLISLGIDRVVRINGDVVAQSTLQIDNVGKAATVTGTALSGPMLVQNGQATQLATGALNSALGGTIVQNTLNDQLISSQTTLRASVNNAGMLQSMNFNSSLNQALTNAVSSK